MRRVRYAVATSLDGYIAGPNGEFDWIVMDPEIDFGELFSRFDTVLMGRRTFEAMANTGTSSMTGMEVFVFSRTLRQQDCPGVTVVAENAEATVATLRSSPGKDIWLFGGGSLFRSLAEAGVVDTVETAVVPILLGGGIPILETPAPRVPLTLTGQKVYRASGIVSLEYDVKA